MTETRTRGYALLSRYRSQLMGIAMLWVMLFHAYPFTFGIGALDEFKSLGFGGVDIFLLLSGMGLSVSLHKKPDTTLRDFYRRRVLRILPTFWLVVGPYSLLLMLRGRIPGSTVLWNLSTLYYWFHIEGAFNWYVPGVLAFYLLTPFLVKLVRRHGCREWLAAAMLPLAYGLYRLALAVGVGYIADVLYRLPVFFLGLLMGAYVVEEQPFTRSHGVFWTLAAVVGLAAGRAMLDQRIPVSVCFAFAVLAVPVCLLLGKLLSVLPGWLNGFLGLLGQCSLEIYLLNVLVTREFGFLSRFLDFDPRHLIYYAIVYPANLLLGILLHKLLHRPKPPAA